MNYKHIAVTAVAAAVAVAGIFTTARVINTRRAKAKIEAAPAASA